MTWKKSADGGRGAIEMTWGKAAIERLMPEIYGGQPERDIDFDEAALVLEQLTTIDDGSRFKTRDAAILYRRFSGPATHVQLSAEFGLSPARVGQIITRLLRRLRHPKRRTRWER
jgi:DNA-directed RNA polymerase sigma subunit (sigma70/sigma32)